MNNSNTVAYNILPLEQFPVLADYLKGKQFDKKACKWEFFSNSSRILPLYLRPILKAVPYTYYKDDSVIIEYINLLKNNYSKSKSPSKLMIPDSIMEKIPSSIKRFLKKDKNDKHLDPYLFEVYVYQKIYHELERGRLCCNDSISYCDIDIDLVDDSLVDRVEPICEELGFPKIPIYCDARLDEALSELNNAWQRLQTTSNKIQILGLILKPQKKVKNLGTYFMTVA